VIGSLTLQTDCHSSHNESYWYTYINRPHRKPDTLRRSDCAALVGRGSNRQRGGHCCELYPEGVDGVEKGGGVTVTLDELAREGARRMIAAVLEAEVDEYVQCFPDELDSEGRGLVVRNRRGKERRDRRFGHVADPRAARERRARGRGDRRAGRFQLADLAALRASLAAGD
jgi:hypothetical protein